MAKQPPPKNPRKPWLKRPTKKRTTPLEVKRRVEEVIKLKLQGWTLLEIFRHSQEQGWGIGIGQVECYLTRAIKQINKSIEDNREHLIYSHVAKRRILYRLAVDKSDLRTAALILKDEAELLGLYAPKRTELTGPDGSALQIEVVNDAERDEAILAILATTGNRPGIAGQDVENRSFPMEGTATDLHGIGHNSGSMADGPAPLFPPSVDPALLPPGGEVPGSVGPGSSDSVLETASVDLDILQDPPAKR